MISEQKAAARELPGFGWWALQGWASLIVGTLVCLGQLSDLGGFAVLLVVLNLALSVMILRYSKTAFVIATVLSINPILWVINGIYVRNRWNDPRVLENKEAQGGAVSHPPEPAIAGTVSRSEGRTAPLASSAEVALAEPASASNIDVLSDEELWARAMAEAESEGRRQGLWAKCFGESGGVEAAAKAAYMAARVTEMKAEIRAEREAIDSKMRAEALERHLARLSEEQRAYEMLPKGTCPNCDALIPVSSVECPKCSANFGRGAAWKVKPLA
jgi:hypothetical protein